MTEKTENWRLILDGAQALTAVGQTPFTRISIYEWIWQRYPRSSHDRPSLDPTFQGMVRNATGGPRSLAGTPLIRVGRGQYVLAGGRDEAGVTRVAPTERVVSPPHRIAASSLAEGGLGRVARELPEAAVIEVAIGRANEPDRFRVDVLHSAAGEASTVTTLDAAGLLARHAELQQAVLASAVPVRRVLEATEQRLRDAGRELFAALLGSGQVAARYQASAAVAAARGQLLRVVTRIDDPLLAGLPWEAMYDDTTGEYVCRSGQVVRYVPIAAPVPPLAVELPLQILAIASSPRGLPTLDVDRERELLDRALGSLAQAGLAEVHWASSAAWADLQDTLLGGQWHVVHFIGHGDFDPRRDEGIIALVGADGRADLVEASRLVDLLRQARPMPRLVVLNSCAGAAGGQEDLFSGTAAALARGGVSAVAAMQYEISDPAAVAFCRGFYGAIARGHGVDEAVTSGRVAIIGLSGRTLEWVTPVLYLRGRDSRLFTMPGRSSADTAAPGNRGEGLTSKLATTLSGDASDGRGHTATPRSDVPGFSNAEPADTEPEIVSHEPPVVTTTSARDADRHQLQVGLVYTRAQLRKLFAIEDATINNGVFPIRNRHEIWLFVTEQKPAGHVQYKDNLIGDELHWQGQSLGRTDGLIVNHRENGNDILVFYRKAKDEFPGFGFKLQGRFDYISHTGKMPASFILRRRKLSAEGTFQPWTLPTPGLPLTITVRSGPLTVGHIGAVTAGGGELIASRLYFPRKTVNAVDGDRSRSACIPEMVSNTAAR